MTLRKLMSQGLPKPPEEAPGARALLDEALNLPLLAPINLFWLNLRDLRPWWPVLLPLLAWTGWSAYQSERRKIELARGERIEIDAEA